MEVVFNNRIGMDQTCTLGPAEMRRDGTQVPQGDAGAVEIAHPQRRQVPAQPGVACRGEHLGGMADRAMRLRQEGRWRQPGPGLRFARLASRILRRA